METKNDETVIDERLSKSTNQFPVVGIGASAGGLDAFKKLLKAIQPNSGMAYVLVQHLDPHHESMLPEILQKSTPIPVLEIADEVRVMPDHIYIIPSNKMLMANDGVLQLSARATGKYLPNMPIDLFFSSLAIVHQSHAIGVVLSGTATDGTIGLKAIRDLGGITFAQDEASAAYKGMPQSAIEANVVDFILPPEEIPQKLLEIKQTVNRSDEELLNISPVEEGIYQHILSMLRIRKGTDFTYYKQTTIRRRILRRMSINKSEAPSIYLDYLKENTGEQDALYQDLLIPVTTFFRDKQVFDNLCDSVLPKLVKQKQAGEPVRVWVTSCSTGEEAYTLAICLLELLGNGPGKAQIFATDISEPAIAKARTGIYTQHEVAGIDSVRLERFFVKTNGSYQLIKQVRDICVFALHDFIKDPPFSKIDLVSCRNVLIYLQPYLQKKAFTTFHYALNPNGFLLLGKSETAASMPDLFTLVNRADKLFTRKNSPARFIPVASQRSEKNSQFLKTEIPQTDFEKTVNEILLEKYTPPGIVVNQQMEIVQYRGATSNYMEQVSGKPTHNLFKLAKNGLAFELRNILQKAKKENKAILKENIPLQVNGNKIQISIEAIPLPNIVEPHYLVLFIEPAATSNSKRPVPSTKAKRDEKDLYIQSLEKEFAQTREDMRSVTEEQEAANEELQSANEELLSGSEELQSLNEELETSKEELQSTNEELISVNEQVTHARLYSELIVSTIREPLLVMDKDLRIKSANTAFYETFKFKEVDTKGILIYNLGGGEWNIPSLRHLLEKIIPKKASFKDVEITVNFATSGKRIMLMNARRMKNENTSEKLILLVIEDITERKEAERKLQESEAFSSSVIESSPDCIKILDSKGRLQFMNKRGMDLMEISDFDKLKNTYWWEFWDKENGEIVKDGISKALIGEKAQFQAWNTSSKGTLKCWEIIVLHIETPDSVEKTHQLLCVSRDITEQVNNRVKERELLNRFHDIVLQVTVGIIILRGTDFIIEMANNAFLNLLGKEESEVVGKSLFMSNSAIRPVAEPLLLGILSTGIPYVGSELEYSLKRNGKLEKCYFNFVCQPLLEAGKPISGIVCVVNEVTELVIARNKMEAQATMVENLLMNAPGFISTLSGPDHVYQLVNEQYQQLFGTRQIKGLPIMEALPELKGQGFDLLLDKVYTTGEPYAGNEVPITLSRDTGLPAELRYFNFSYQPMYNENKAIYSVLVFGYEVTEQVIAKNKNIENSLLREKALEEKVQERTLELRAANELLLSKNDELVKMNKELQAFTFISSHDLQEPLRKIKTFTNLIVDTEKQTLSEQGKDYFDRIQRSANRMQMLIEDLLIYSQAINHEAKFEKTNLDKILGEVKNDLAEIIISKKAIIEAEHLCDAYVIPFQFRQLFNNLITNSLKFSHLTIAPHIVIKSKIGSGTEFNKGILQVSNEPLIPDKQYCHISFSDNGIGFEVQFTDKIFELFQRLHNREEYPGTGIGLAIVKKIIENHEGLIIATSKLHKGSTFDIYIPVH